MESPPGPQPGGEIQEIGYHGVLAQVDGHTVAACNDKLMDRSGSRRRPAARWAPSSTWRWTGSTFYHILIADVVKPTARPPSRP